MARARNIKPGFFTNDVLAELPPLARLLFAGLWTLCDRAGRAEDRPKRIKAEVLAYDDCDCDALLQALHDKGFIRRYEANGARLIQVLTWDKHQNPHVKEAASSLPAPEQHQTSTGQEQCSPQPLPERAGLIPDSLIPDSGFSDSGATDVAQGATRAKSQRGTRLPDDWAIPDEWVSKTLEEYPHWTLETVHAIATKFGRYWRARAGKEAVKRDWLATFQNWCSGEITQREHPPPGSKAQPQSFRERDAELAKEQGRRWMGTAAPQNFIDMEASIARIEMD